VLVGRALGLVHGRNCAQYLLVAPALGLLTFGGFSHFFCYYLGYDRLRLALAWFSFVSLNLLVSYLTRKRPLKAIYLERWLSVGAYFGAVLDHFHLFPIVYREGLYFGVEVSDQAGTAMIATAAREGLPMIDPYFASVEGAPLIYYYLWHFNAAHLCLLGGLSA